MPISLGKRMRDILYIKLPSQTKVTQLSEPLIPTATSFPIVQAQPFFRAQVIGLLAEGVLFLTKIEKAGQRRERQRKNQMNIKH